MEYLKLHQKQSQIIQSQARFKIIRAGRRGGKTSLEVEAMSFDAVSKKDRPIIYIAPTQIQARSIVWEMLKKRLHGVGEANESRLEMKVPTQDGGFSTIFLAGWENRENFRGRPAYAVVFDETDTMRDFFIGWQEIFRPALVDMNGKATFIGTPKKENPNLRRLEKLAETDKDYECFHFTTADNPSIDPRELAKAKEETDYETYRQEYLAEYIDNQGALFSYNCLVDVFSNTVDNGGKYLIVDIADDGSDKTIFSFWDGLEEYKRDAYERLNTENIIVKIREYTALDRIPYSHVAVDAVGVGAGVASSSMLDGIIGFKGSYGAIKTDANIVRLPNVGYLNNAAALTSDYKNLRSQCIFTLADFVNNHKVASRVEGRFKEYIIEELSTYQDTSKGDGKRMAMSKDEVKQIIGRSPDHSDTWQMRMYFEIMKKVVPDKGIEDNRVLEKQLNQFNINQNNFLNNSNK